jgi:regulatory protein
VSEEVKNNFITSVEQQQKNKHRYNIYIDGEYSFAVHEDILIKYRLLKGREIELQELKEILASEELNRAKQAALNYLSYRPRTVEELRNQLLTKGFEVDVCSEITFQMQQQGYLDDEEYAKQWVRERKHSRPRGKYLLRQELVRRGIDKDIVDEVIDQELSPDEAIQMIKSLIDKKYRNVRFSDYHELKMKMIPFLQRKGFSFDLILSVLEKIKAKYL